MRKFYQKRASPEYHFVRDECTVVRNPADGRKRVRCDVVEDRYKTLIIRKDHAVWSMLHRLFSMILNCWASQTESISS